MSIMGKLNYFLKLYIKQSKEGIFVNQTKYTKELLKWFNMENTKPFGTPMSALTKLDLDEGGKKVNVTLYRGTIHSLL